MVRVRITCDGGQFPEVFVTEGKGNITDRSRQPSPYNKKAHWSSVGQAVAQGLVSPVPARNRGVRLMIIIEHRIQSIDEKLSFSQKPAVICPQHQALIAFVIHFSVFIAVN